MKATLPFIPTRPRKVYHYLVSIPLSFPRATTALLIHLYTGTLNNTKTALGRSLLRTWLLRPSLSLAVINARHDAVACFLRSENIVPAGVMHAHLNGVKNVPRILGVMRTGRARLSEWQGLVKV